MSVTFPTSFDFSAAPPQPLYQQAAPRPFPRLAPPKNGFPAAAAAAPRNPKSVLGSLGALIPAQTDAEYVAGLEKHLEQLSMAGTRERVESADAVRPSAPLLSNRDEDDDEAEHDFGPGFEAEVAGQVERQQGGDAGEDDGDACRCCG